MSSSGYALEQTRTMRTEPDSSGNRPHTVLPPIIAPPEANESRDVSFTLSAGGRHTPLSRANSVSSERSLLKVQHILNPPATSNEPISGPPTPDSAARSLPPFSLHRSVSCDRVSTIGSQYGQSHSSRLPTTLQPPTGTIDAKKTPFLPTAHRSSAVSTSSAVSALGSRPAHAVGGPRLGVDYGLSRSRTGSPASTYSSYGPPGTTNGSPRSEYSSLGASHHYPTQHESQRLYAMSQHQSAHQGVLQAGPQYRTIIIDTDQGPIQVPVDVQAASKMADEKRKRNAGASARFRQRRKEKEREASQTIQRLETQVRELEGDREYYRLERNYYRDIVSKHDDTKAHLVPRMPSPGALSDRRRQSSLTSSQGDSPVSPKSARGQDYRQIGEREDDNGRIVRRRVSDYGHENLSRQQSQQDYYGSASHNEQSQQPPQHQRSAGPPPPIQIQDGNAHYSLPTPDSKVSTPRLPASLPPMEMPTALRGGRHDVAGRPGQVATTLETKWAT